jgi:hypothetical protein
MDVAYGGTSFVKRGDWRFLDMDTITSDVSVFSGLELSDTLTLNWKDMSIIYIYIVLLLPVDYDISPLGSLKI